MFAYCRVTDWEENWEECYKINKNGNLIMHDTYMIGNSSWPKEW